MPLHPTRYATMLSEKIRDAQARVWLVNTGWTAGPYGEGKRMSLPYTRALITAALDGKLENVAYETMEVFGLAMPTSCPGVPAELLNPKRTWKESDAYDQKLAELATAFLKNFEKFAASASEEVAQAAPRINELSHQ